MGFVDKFLANKPGDKFFNLKRKEDISTIYHDEYKEHHEDLDNIEQTHTDHYHQEDMPTESTDITNLPEPASTGDNIGSTLD